MGSIFCICRASVGILGYFIIFAFVDRYLRNIKVVGTAGQSRLAEAVVLVAGCGALGGQTAMLLAAAGVGRLILIDFDTVCISNLQRQLFYREEDAGKLKASLLADRIHALNSEVDVEVYPEMLTYDNAGDMISRADFVVEATDNHAPKAMIEEVCREKDVPCCIGGVAGWRGQVVTVADGSKGMSHLFPDAGDDGSVLPCEAEGVMGPVASAIASMQASEALKYLTGQGELLLNKCFFCDLSANLYATFDL